jgi:hypothetical protein
MIGDIHIEGSIMALYIETTIPELEADDGQLVIMRRKASLGCSIPTLQYHPTAPGHGGRGCRSDLEGRNHRRCQPRHEARAGLRRTNISGRPLGFGNEAI